MAAMMEEEMEIPMKVPNHPCCSTASLSSTSTPCSLIGPNRIHKKKNRPQCANPTNHQQSHLALPLPSPTDDFWTPGAHRWKWCRGEIFHDATVSLDFGQAD
jgi:hypothetical protein